MFPELIIFGCRGVLVLLATDKATTQHTQVLFFTHRFPATGFYPAEAVGGIVNTESEYLDT